MFRPSEIVLLPFPFTDLSSHKKRPVLILTAANAQADFLAVQITSQPGHANAITLHNEDFVLGSLPKTSYVRPDKIVTLNQSLIIQRIGKLSDTASKRILQAVCSNLNCASLYASDDTTIYKIESPRSTYSLVKMY